MIIGIGADITDIRRIEDLLEKFGGKFVSRVFNESERIDLNSPKAAAHYAKRFAGKEAVAKAFGTGIGRIGFRDITIGNHESGQPFATVEGAGDAVVHISLSDEYPYAFAMVVVEERNS